MEEMTLCDRWTLRFTWISGLLAMVAGCSGQPAGVEPPSFDTGKVATAAVAQYDKDGNGQLEQGEWQASGALAGSIEVYDTNGDMVLSREEIAAGLARWQKGEMGARPLPFQVKLGGRPLEGADVKLIPEEFFAGAIKPASGTSGAGGRGYLGLSEADRPKNAPQLPLTQPGLYRVEITHPRQKIPAKYNTESTLGIEVADDRIDPRGVVWDL
jgi:hypothetical protein